MRPGKVLEAQKIVKKHGMRLKRDARVPTSIVKQPWYTRRIGELAGCANIAMVLLRFPLAFCDAP
jgi:hypothetical protein